jgi:hypothetical protein
VRKLLGVGVQEAGKKVVDTVSFRDYRERRAIVSGYTVDDDTLARTTSWGA